ncbi:MAG TPA: zf-HC2 domain-containing protein [Acidobacteriota bacterium]|nr:zf-HC2 domain-containing protein [Acidobacteriota bacterium]HNT17704.1 zf-HC2 domain-containing protein [Acidobacteriota bacterium]
MDNLREDAMRCKKVLELLSRFIENDFADEESAEIKAHIDKCEGCRKEYEAMKSLLDRLETIPLVCVPLSFKDAVMKHLPEKKDEDK